MRLRATLLALCLGSVAWAGAAGAGPGVPLHEDTVTKSFPGPIHAVVVHGDEGAVSVVAGKATGLRAHEAWNFDQPTISATLRQGVLTIDTDCKERHQVAGTVYADGFNECTVDLTVTVPATTDVSVKADYGTVSASGVSGALKLRASSGSVLLADVRHGTVDASTGYGDVRAERVTAASVRLRSDGGSVTARAVRAADFAAHSGYGTVTAEAVRATTAEVTSDSGEVTLSGLRATQLVARSGYGPVNVRSSSASVAQLRASSGSVMATGLISRAMQVSSGYGDITLSRTQASNLFARSDSGSLAVELTRAPDNASVSSGYGKASLTVPTGRYAVSATSGYGQVHVEQITVDPHADKLLSVYSDSGDVLVRGV